MPIRMSSCKPKVEEEFDHATTKLEKALPHPVMPQLLFPYIKAICAGWVSPLRRVSQHKKLATTKESAAGASIGCRAQQQHEIGLAVQSLTGGLSCMRCALTLVKRWLTALPSSMLQTKDGQQQ